MKNLKNLTKVQLIEQLQKQKDENNKDSVNQNKAVETKQNFNMNNIIKLRKIRRTNV
jgi:hypothetical protein